PAGEPAPWITAKASAPIASYTFARRAANSSGGKSAVKSGYPSWARRAAADSRKASATRARIPRDGIVGSPPGRGMLSPADSGGEIEGGGLVDRRPGLAARERRAEDRAEQGEGRASRRC